MDSPGTARLALGAAVIAGAAIAGFAAPPASAAPCTAAGLSDVSSGVLNEVSGWLAQHPDADQVLTDAAFHEPAAARDMVRGYFMGHIDQALELQQLTQPLTDLKNQCGVALSPSSIAKIVDTITE